MRLFLRPNDGLFFRDGRPFSSGQQTEGYSIFPPLPSTLMGAIRSAYIAQEGGLIDFLDGKMEPAIGTHTSMQKASLQLRGVFVGQSGAIDSVKSGQDEVYYPVPRDLVAAKNSADTKLFPLSVGKSDFYSNSRLENPLTYQGDEVVVSPTGWLVQSQLRQFLLGPSSDLTYLKPDFIIDEPKIGIKRDTATNTAEEGMLYRLAMKRFKTTDYGLVVDLSGIDQLAQEGLLRLGGEGKTCIRQPFDMRTNPLGDPDLKRLSERVQESRSFKLYLATPAIFEQGWRPKCLGQDGIWKIITNAGAGLQLQLITAAVGNYITAGGWSIEGGRAKTAYRAVPAGSVYYFKLLEDTCATSLVDHFHNQNRSDLRRQEGFGLTYVGITD
ncbi:MAG: type III-B CRISPR module-associated protein Cmr3 [Candidatus Poribacteria bacterium]|nr:type III-B CRISPR module-associated protein Cmr3 [Candidatus Poribacteria bacterium]